MAKQPMTQKTPLLTPEQVAQEDAELEQVVDTQGAAETPQDASPAPAEGQEPASASEEVKQRQGSPQNDARVSLADKMVARRRQEMARGENNPEVPEHGPLELEALRRAGDMQAMAAIANGEATTVNPEEEPEPEPPQPVIQPQRASQRVAQESTTGEQYYEVMIDGQPRAVSLSELRANYSMQQATQARLAEAGRVLQEARAFAQGIPPRPAQTPEPQPQPQPQAPTLSEDAVQAIQEGITLGDPAAAAKAIGQIVELARQGVPPPGQPIDQTMLVRSAIDEDRRRSATQRFLADNLEEMQDPTMRNLAVDAVLEEMKADAKGLNLSPQEAYQLSLGIAHTARQYGISVEDAFRAFHNQMRAEGYAGFRDPDTLLNAGLERARGEVRRLAGVHTPAPTPQTRYQPAPTMQDRMERKRAVQTQPAQRRAPQIPREEPRPPTPSEIIRGMNQSRGFLVGGALPQRRA